jgi:hypothetical protein
MRSLRAVKTGTPTPMKGKGKERKDAIQPLQTCYNNLTPLNHPMVSIVPVTKTVLAAALLCAGALQSPQVVSRQPCVGTIAHTHAPSTACLASGLHAPFMHVHSTAALLPGLQVTKLDELAQLECIRKHKQFCTVYRAAGPTAPCLPLKSPFQRGIRSADQPTAALQNTPQNPTIHALQDSLDTAAAIENGTLL